MMAAMSEIDPNIRSRPIPDSEVQSAKMSSAPTTPEKRPADTAFQSENQVQVVLPPRQTSPALSSSSELTSVSVVAQRANDQATSAPPPKRRKLTAEEKEQQRLEKEERGRKRAEEKLRKEEEKLKKDEERKVKLEEREEKRREKEIEKQQKEEEKRLKDEEKRLKEEEKQKKEQAQKRINSFFAKPSTPSKPVAAAPDHESSPLSHSGLPQLNDTTTLPESESPLKSLSDYSSYFLPFALPSNSILAPYNSFTWDYQASSHFDDILKKAFSSSSDSPDQCCGRLVEILDLPRDKARGFLRPSVKEIMEHMESSSNHPVDLTTQGRPSIWDKPLAVLKSIPTKNILFHEDVRPPYRGTYSKINDQGAARRLARNPHLKSRPDTNYDYDSEAEWEDPGEGEDLNSEGESDAESLDGGEDMDGFLDDEEAADLTLQRRRHVGGDLEPACSGLCWADENGRYTDSSNENVPDRSTHKLRVLSVCFKAPIDPFSDSYWKTSSDKPESASPPTTKQTKSMEPPKHPLQLKPNTMVNGARGPGRPRADGSAPKASKGPVRLLVGDELEEFKKAIEGSDLTKLGLIEVLKKRFPKSSKESIKDTLSTVAARVGARDADKRWRIIQSAT